MPCPESSEEQALMMVRVAVPLLALMVAGAALADNGKSVWQGVFSPAQADHGAAVYAQRCSGCHGAGLGGTGEAPPLVGGEFVSHWDTLSLGDLYDRVRTTMPQNDPQSLSRDEYADVVAFLLKSNGFPAGELPMDKRSEVLATIGITAQKPAAGR
jgi:mono/diheme cytochrome c family protein